MANFQLGDNQQVPYSLNLLDAQGNPAANVPGDIPGVTSNDTTVIKVVPDATPVAGTVASGFLVAQGKIGAGIIITAVVQMPTGSGPNLTSTDTIDVVGGAPATLGFSLGTPVPIGAATPPPPGP